VLILKIKIYFFNIYFLKKNFKSKYHYYKNKIKDAINEKKKRKEKKTAVQNRT
jgi:hypothetical protein